MRSVFVCARSARNRKRNMFKYLWSEVIAAVLVMMLYYWEFFLAAGIGVWLFFKFVV